MASPESTTNHGNTGRIVTILLVLLFVATRLWQLTAYPLSLDEIFSLSNARRGWAEMLAYVAWDVVHPPAFYLLLKVWIGIGGDSLLWLRLLPALTAIASIVPLYFLGQELKLRAVEIRTALFFMAVNGYLIYYSQELRMYSLMLFLTVCSLWLFARWNNSERRREYDLMCLFIVNLLLIYTHYFGLLIVGVEIIYVLIWSRDRWFQFCIVVAFLAVCFSPWVYLVVDSAVERGGLVRNLGWLTRPRLFDFIWYYATLHGTVFVPRSTTIGTLLFGGPLAWFAWRSLRSRDSINPMLFWGLGLFAFVPLLIAFCASWILPYSVWEERSLIIAAVPYMLLIAISVNRLRVKWVRILILGLVIAWSFVAGAAAMRREKKIRWDVLARSMSQSEQLKNDKVTLYVFEPFVEAPLRHVLESQGESRFNLTRVNQADGLRAKHFWVAFRDTTWRELALPQVVLKANGCSTGKEIQSGTADQTVILFSVDCP